MNKLFQSPNFVSIAWNPFGCDLHAMAQRADALRYKKTCINKRVVVYNKNIFSFSLHIDLNLNLDTTIWPCCQQVSNLRAKYFWQLLSVYNILLYTDETYFLEDEGSAETEPDLKVEQGVSEIDSCLQRYSAYWKEKGVAWDECKTS